MQNRVNQQVDNNLAFVHDIVSRNESWISRPAWVEFSTNNACNLRCVMCGQSDGEPPRHMDRDRAAVVLDQLFDSATVITPHANSEPLLADFDLVYEKCREHDVSINLITNASYLDAARFEAIADRLWSLTFSLDSHRKEVLERIRVRVDYECVTKNIREVLPIAAKMGMRTAFNLVLMSANAEDLPGFVDWVADAGGVEAHSVVHVQPMIYNAEGCQEMRLEARFDEAQLQSILDAACERAEARGIILLSILPGKLARNVTPVEPRVRGVLPDLLARTITTLSERYPTFCNMAAYYMKVSPDGRVYPCCVGPDELAMGSVYDSSIEEIWNGENYRSLRRRMFAGDYPECCRNCSILVANPHFPAAPSI